MLATIVDYDEAPNAVHQFIRALWADEEAYNGDYVRWFRHHAEKYPALADWIKTREHELSQATLIHFSW